MVAFAFSAQILDGGRDLQMIFVSLGVQLVATLETAVIKPCALRNSGNTERLFSHPNEPPSETLITSSHHKNQCEYFLCLMWVRRKLP